jgi:hypothetical protein
VLYNFDIVIIPTRAMQQSVGIVLICSRKLSDDVIPVLKLVRFYTCHELYLILLSTCVGWCVNCKNLHGMHNIKSERKGIVKRSGRK